MSDWLDEHLAAEARRRTAAMVDGKHYTALVPRIKALRKSRDDDAAAGLLLRAIDAIEREAAIPLAGHISVPRWFFDQLSAIHSKAGNESASALVMQRFVVLSAEVELSGRLALARMREAGQEQPRAPARPKSRPASYRAAKSAGKAVGLLSRLAKSLLK